MSHESLVRSRIRPKNPVFEDGMRLMRVTRSHDFADPQGLKIVTRSFG